MSDNPQYGTAAAFALPGIRVVAISGRDAVAFAQSQFMNDVAPLGDSQWQWSGWLDPKGRVQGLFALLRLDAESIWLVTTAAPAFEQALARFVFRSKVRIEVLPLAASGVLARPGRAHGGMARHEAGVVELDFSGDAGARTLRLSPEAAIDSASDEQAWWALDLRHGWPGLPGVPLAYWTPQQLSLHRMNAFSVKKGCYPGQEIVARTHFLGRAKRALVGFHSTAASPGDAIVNADGRDVGAVVACAGGHALAVMPIDHDAAVGLHDGTPIRFVPLASGLER